MVLGEDAWGLVDEAMTCINVNTMTVCFSPNRKDRTKMWMVISFLVQDVVKHPDSCMPK